MLASTLFNHNALSTNIISKTFWSIGDRFHDWWPCSRGELEKIKKCGDWKFLPSIIRYGIACDSISAYKKRYALLDHLNKDALQNEEFQYVSNTDIKVTQEDNRDYGGYGEVEEYKTYDPPTTIVWTANDRLNSLANNTLTKLQPVTSIEDNILRSYTNSERKTFNSITRQLNNPANIDDAIQKYKEICHQLFGADLTNYKWFAVICDAGNGPWCKLFLNILKNSNRITIDQIKAFCLLHGIPVMYMIQTPQTITDSAFNMTFIACLILYRFPITHIRAGAPAAAPGPAAAGAGPLSERNPPGYVKIPEPMAGVLHAGTNKEFPNREQPPIYNLETDKNGIFVCKNNLFTFDTHRISFHRGINNVNEYTFVEGGGTMFRYRITNSAETTVDIDYGPKGSIYRYTGPSLYELTLQYVHKNLLDAVIDDVGIEDGGIATFPPDSTSIYNSDIYYDDVIFHPFRNAFEEIVSYVESDSNNNNSQNVESEKTYVRLVTKLGSIKTTIDSGLGLLATAVDPSRKGTGTTGDMLYKPLKDISLCLVPNYDTLPARIMPDIKHEGDASQVDALDALNKTPELHDRLVFISKDRPCIANAVNRGFRAIQFGSTEICIYNYALERYPVADAGPAAAGPAASKKRKATSTAGGGINNSIDDCVNECLDVEEIMITIGMHAFRYITTIKDIKTITLNSVMHYNLLRNFYDDIGSIYDEYHRNLENDITDIDLKYTGDMKLFMIILRKLHYHEINRSNAFNALIALCNIHHRYYGMPIIKQKPASHKTITRKHKSTRKSASQKPKSTRKSASQKPISQIRKSVSQNLFKKLGLRQSHKRKSKLHNAPTAAPAAGGSYR